MSERIASEEGNPDCHISHGRIVQVEKNRSIPSIYKLFSLSAIYGIALIRLLQLYLDTDSVNRYHLSFGLERTRAIELDEYIPPATIEFPLEFDQAATVSRTGVLNELVKLWGHVPASLLNQISLRQHRYGVIGLADYSMYPLLRPGSIVQIDDRQKPGAPRRYASEHERPVYFIQTRSGYLCCWCEMGENRLVTIPYPLGPYRIREFKYPDEAEVVGRIVAVVARLDSVAGVGTPPGV